MPPNQSPQRILRTAAQRITNVTKKRPPTVLRIPYIFPRWSFVTVSNSEESIGKEKQIHRVVKRRVGQAD